MRTAVPPNVTSNMSLAGFTPASGLVDATQRTAAWDAQYFRAANIAFRQLQLLAGTQYGVSWLDNYSLTNNPPAAQAENAERPNLDAPFNTGREVYGPGEHPFATKYAVRSPQIRFRRRVT